MVVTGDTHTPMPGEDGGWRRWRSSEKMVGGGDGGRRRKWLWSPEKMAGMTCYLFNKFPNTLNDSMKEYEERAVYLALYRMSSKIMTNK
ncbi:hypothetical protein OSB04_028142 [Centaurea solstitialis]|uniref:Uncharacterized protein n=1 Tax=Centaurea solstitialis TaxID=347529 RepID=A0AA38STF1_9ASTR|nr:hypothetical protein OSB04_028142 [Centaurea solstitialis]